MEGEPGILVVVSLGNPRSLSPTREPSVGTGYIHLEER